jgi:hypothetical protein
MWPLMHLRALPNDTDAIICLKLGAGRQETLPVARSMPEPAHACLCPSLPSAI